MNITVTFIIIFNELNIKSKIDFTFFLNAFHKLHLT
jgi:hypothetical protein